MVAGAVTALLVDGDLRYIEIGGIEVVRRIYVAVRDLDWNTIPGELRAFDARIESGEFEIKYSSRHTDGALDYECDVQIVGTAGGTIQFRMFGRALSSFLYAKIGLCVHHPIQGFAGSPFLGTTPSGEVRGTLPDLIGPQIRLDDGTDLPLFAPVSALSLDHESGGTVSFEFEGDLWEMEDQRNWSDASYKSASTPASLGYRHSAEAGQRFVQSIVVRANGFTDRVGGRPASRVRLEVQSNTGTTVPPIGLGLSAESVEHTPRARRAITRVGPAHLRVDISSEAPDAKSLRHAAELATDTGAQLEVALMLEKTDPQVTGLSTIAKVLSSYSSALARILVFNKQEESTSHASIALVQGALIDVDTPLISGTNIYFNELNRHRISPGTAQGLAWSLNPQIHAFDELSIMENLQAQPDMIATAREIFPETELYVTPVTLRPRFNAVATTHSDLDSSLSPVDPRQTSLFAAAWTLGSVAALVPAGVDGVTFFETIGPRGILNDFPDIPENTIQHFPVAVVIADACDLRGGNVLQIKGIDSSRIAAIAVEHGGISTVLIANLTDEPLEVELTTEDFSSAAIRILDQESWLRAVGDFESFLSHREIKSGRKSESIILGPYASIRADLKK